MPIYSRPVKLAIQVLTCLSGPGDKESRTVRDVAMMTGVSEPTVAKTLQTLARGGILESQKGPGGGFRLASPPVKINLEWIVSVVEGKDPFEECLWGFKECSPANPCPLHDKWMKVKEDLDKFLQKTTLQDVFRAAKSQKGKVGEDGEGRFPPDKSLFS